MKANQILVVMRKGNLQGMVMAAEHQSKYKSQVRGRLSYRTGSSVMLCEDKWAKVVFCHFCCLYLGMWICRSRVMTGRQWQVGKVGWMLLHIPPRRLSGQWWTERAFPGDEHLTMMLVEEKKNKCKYIMLISFRCYNCLYLSIPEGCDI